MDDNKRIKAKEIKLITVFVQNTRKLRYRYGSTTARAPVGEGKFSSWRLARTARYVSHSVSERLGGPFRMVDPSEWRTRTPSMIRRSRLGAWRHAWICRWAVVDLPPNPPTPHPKNLRIYTNFVGRPVRGWRFRGDPWGIPGHPSPANVAILVAFPLTDKYVTLNDLEWLFYVKFYFAPVRLGISYLYCMYYGPLVW